MKTFILRIALVLVSFVSSVATAQEKTVVTNDGTVYELVQPAQQPTAVMPGQKIRLGEQCTIARDGFWHQTTTCVWEQTLVASDEDLTVEAGGSASDTFVREDVVAIFIGISCILLAMLLVHWAISSATTTAAAATATAVAAFAFAAATATATLAFAFATATLAFVAAVAATLAFAAAAESRKWFLILGTVYCGLMVMSLFLI
jgi:hypothetical protein